MYKYAVVVVVGVHEDRDRTFGQLGTVRMVTPWWGVFGNTDQVLLEMH